MNSDHRITDEELKAAAMRGETLAVEPSRLKDRYDELDLVPCMRCGEKLHVEIMSGVEKPVHEILDDPRAAKLGLTLEKLRADMDRPDLDRDSTIKTGVAMLCCDMCGLFEDASQAPEVLVFKAIAGTLNIRKLDDLDFTQMVLGGQHRAVTVEQMQERYDDMPLIPCPTCGGKLWVEMRVETQTVAQVLESENVTLDMFRETTRNSTVTLADKVDVMQPYVHCDACGYVASGGTDPFNPAD